MAKKTLELVKLIQSLSLDQVAILHRYRGDKDFKHFVSTINHVITLDKDKTVGLVSDINSTDAMIKCVNKQNFYRGRINFGVLLHGLMVNAERELNRRESASKK